MTSRHHTDPRQPHVNQKPKKKRTKKARRSRSKPTELKVEFTWAEPTPEGDAAWRSFINFLIDAQLENMRKRFGEAGPIALLKYVEEGKIDPLAVLGLQAPPGPTEGKRDKSDPTRK